MDRVTFYSAEEELTARLEQMDARQQDLSDLVASGAAAPLRRPLSLQPPSAWGPTPKLLLQRGFWDPLPQPVCQS